MPQPDKLPKIHEIQPTGLHSVREGYLKTGEEWFITDYECPIYGVQKLLGEYESLDKLNYLAALIDELSLGDQEKLAAIMEAGCDEVSDIDDLINLTFNLDCYDIMPGINDEYDLGYYYANEAGIYSEKDLGPLADYID